MAYRQSLPEEALRQQAGQELAYMTRILEEIQRTIGCGFHWSHLNLKRRQFERYAFNGMIADIQRVPRGLDSNSIQHLLIGIIHKLDVIGPKPFARTLNNLVETCADILNKELDKIESVLETSTRGNSNSVAELRAAAHERVEKVFTYLATIEAHGGGISFIAFWQLVSLAYKTIQDLSRCIYRSSESGVNSLDMYIGRHIGDFTSIRIAAMRSRLPQSEMFMSSPHRVPTRGVSIIELSDKNYASPDLRHRATSNYASPMLRARLSPLRS